MLISRTDNIIKIDSIIIEPNKVKISNFIIKSPGEYEVQNIFVHAINKDILVFETKQIKIGFVRKPKLTDKQLEAINNIDILITNNLDLANQVEPKLVIQIKDINKLAIKKTDLPKQGVKIWKS